MTSDSFTPKQQRSRETLARLLGATLITLNKHGLEGATIPRIAAVARVAPATVYRRFQNRDALLRATFIDFLEKIDRKGLRTQLLEKITLDGVVDELVVILIKQYQIAHGVLEALIQFIERDSDENFKAKALELDEQTGKMIVGVLLRFRSQISHPNPKRAITLGLTIISTSIHARAFQQIPGWNWRLSISDTELQKELTRNFLAYVGSR